MSSWLQQLRETEAAKKAQIVQEKKPAKKISYEKVIEATGLDPRFVWELFGEQEGHDRKTKVELTFAQAKLSEFAQWCEAATKNATPTPAPKPTTKPAPAPTPQPRLKAAQDAQDTQEHPVAKPTPAIPPAPRASKKAAKNTPTPLPKPPADPDMVSLRRFREQVAANEAAEAAIAKADADSFARWCDEVEAFAKKGTATKTQPSAAPKSGLSSRVLLEQQKVLQGYRELGYSLADN